MERLISDEMLAKAAGIDKWPVPGLDRLLMLLMKLDQFNAGFRQVRHLEGMAFVDGVLEILNIRVDLSDDDVKRIPRSGPFLVVANHPYGGIEGLVLIKVLCSIRPECKLMANFMLEHIKNLRSYFISVNPFHDTPHHSNLAGIRKTLRYLRDGFPVAVFPAGEVSAYQPRLQQVTDKRWHPVIGKLIVKAGVPVIPVYFRGSNSLLFSLLGLVHPALRTARLPAEVLNKKGRSVHVRIGTPIEPGQLERVADRPKALLEFVRARTYALGMDDRKWKWLDRGDFKRPVQTQAIAAPVPLADLELDLSGLSDQRLFTVGTFDVYCTEARVIPSLLLEIGRLREETFRLVGEGTGRAIDLDVFDLHYRHLFIWDKSECCLVGAYRIGIGAEIVYGYGKRGFYLSQLFRMDKEIMPMLQESMELGRSWIRQRYQRSALPMYLLWKGISGFLKNYPQCRYLIGPVSISGDFSRFSRSVIVEFIRRNHGDKDLAALVTPRKRFKPGLMKMNLDALLDDPSSMKSLERLIMDIEKPNLRFPVLLRHYVGLKGKIIAFNVDPKFSYSLDGFIVVDLRQLDETVERRFFGR